jgi:small subunit ribosomal protein S16
MRASSCRASLGWTDESPHPAKGTPVGDPDEGTRPHVVRNGRRRLCLRGSRICRALLGWTGVDGRPYTRNDRKETSSVLMIRLSRVGARKQPHYRVVVIEKERARNGRPVEIVGTYNPRTNPASVELKRERIDYWRSKGAQVSSRVGKILGFAQGAPAEPVAS